MCFSALRSPHYYFVAQNALRVNTRAAMRGRGITNTLGRIGRLAFGCVCAQLTQTHSTSFHACKRVCIVVWRRPDLRAAKAKLCICSKDVRGVLTAWQTFLRWRCKISGDWSTTAQLNLFPQNNEMRYVLNYKELIQHTSVQLHGRGEKLMMENWKKKNDRRTTKEKNGYIRETISNSIRTHWVHSCCHLEKTKHR